MALLDEVRSVLRVSSSRTDIEIESLIDAALADMMRVGIRPELLNEESLDPLVKNAVFCFVKANYGFDNDEAERFMNSYHLMVANLLNSSANIADKSGNNALV